MNTKDKNYFVHSSIFTNQKVGEAFQIFLEQEQNLDTFNFLMEVHALKQDNQNSVKKSKGIIQKYIVTGSPNEINLSKETKDFILDTFKPIRKFVTGRFFYLGVGSKFKRSKPLHVKVQLLSKF
jgi:hypothetical protein